MNRDKTELEALLQRRAEHYRNRDQSDAEAASEYLQFRTSTFTCVVALGAIVRMLAMPEITQVPNMPSNYLGLFASRGVLHEAFSLPKILNESKAEHASMLMLEVDHGAAIGIAVTEVLGIVEYADASAREITDSNWPAFLSKKFGSDIYLLDTDTLLKQLKNSV